MAFNQTADWHKTRDMQLQVPSLGKRIHAVEMFIYSEKLILYATIGSTEMDCKCIEIRLSSSIKTLSTLANPTINCTNSNFNAIAWNLTFLLLFSSFSLPFLFPFFFLFFFSFLFLSSLIMIPQVPPKSPFWLPAHTCGIINNLSTNSSVDFHFNWQGLPFIY